MLSKADKAAKAAQLQRDAELGAALRTLLKCSNVIWPKVTVADEALIVTNGDKLWWGTSALSLSPEEMFISAANAAEKRHNAKAIVREAL